MVEVNTRKAGFERIDLHARPEGGAVIEIHVVISRGLVQEIYASDPGGSRIWLRQYDDLSLGDQDWVRQFPAIRLTEAQRQEFAQEEEQERRRRKSQGS